MRKIIPVIFITLFFSLQTMSQEVFWAVDVDSVSSEYSDDRYGARQVLGPPNVDKQGRHSLYAWSVVPNDINKESVDMAYVEVNYGQSHLVNQLAIFESFNPGAISKIYVSHESKGLNWTQVFVDTNVIRRSVIPEFKGDKNEGLNAIVADDERRDINIFKADEKFQPQKCYGITYLFFDEPRPVYRVRVVINPLAIDGWNQIDAIGITNSLDSVKYPTPILADQSLIVDKKSKNMGYSINSYSSELNPVISPDEKRLYFVKNEFIKNKSIYTQNIWYSDIETIKIPCDCYNNDTCNYTKEDIWTECQPIYWEFNNLIPNAVTGFSPNGEYMYLNNLYQATDIGEDVFSENTIGLSYSHLDSTVWQKASQTDIDKLDSAQQAKINNYIISADANLLLTSKFDTIKNINIISFRTYDERDETWNEPYRLGTSEKAPFSFQVEIDGEYIRYWFDVEEVAKDSVIITELNWSKPTNVQIKDFVNYSNYVNFYISPDRTRMFIAMQDDSTRIDRDIYMSKRNTVTDIWSKPEKLQGNINTNADESSPFLDGDNRSLYFSSSGHNGYGEHDIYISERLDDDWKEWSEPYNLGPKVNTPASEVNFQISENSRMGYFAMQDCSAECNNNSDIFSIQMGKTITIHIVGRTLNVNDNYNPVGNVDVKLNSMQGGRPGYRSIGFKSSKVTGHYNITIKKMVEANKMTKSGMFAKKNTYYQTDKGNRDKSGDYFEKLDLTNPPWELTIKQDLYLYGPPDSISVIPIPRPKRDTVIIIDTIYIADETIIIHDTLYLNNKIDTLYIEGPSKTVIIDLPIDTVGCPTIYHSGILYSLPTGNQTRVERLEPVYFKYFDYNETAIIDKKDFRNLIITKLFAMLKINDKVNVHIVASASHVPTTKYASNFELARMRAENPQKRIKSVLKENNIDEDRVYFDKRYVVQGPEYKGDSGNKKKYKKFQYVKIWIYSCDKAVNK